MNHPFKKTSKNSGQPPGQSAVDTMIDEFPGATEFSFPGVPSPQFGDPLPVNAVPIENDDEPYSHPPSPGRSHRPPSPGRAATPPLQATPPPPPQGRVVQPSSSISWHDATLPWALFAFATVTPLLAVAQSEFLEDFFDFVICLSIPVVWIIANRSKKFGLNRGLIQISFAFMLQNAIWLGLKIFFGVDFRQ